MGFGLHLFKGSTLETFSLFNVKFKLAQKDLLMRLRNLTLLLGATVLGGQIFCASADTEAAAQWDFMGVPLARPIAIPECGTASYSNNAYTLSAPKASPCWEEKYGNPTHSGLPKEHSFMVTLRAPVENSPKGITNAAILIVDGVVEGFSIKTNGMKSQNELLEKLRQKFGEPTEMKPETMQNNFGSKFQRVVAHWSLPGVTVDFFGMDGSIEEGYLKVLSPAGLAHHNEQKKLLQGGSF